MSNNTQLLRFITAGSVDDGKSTLIGRLLHDSKSIFEDQFSAISKTSEKRGMAAVDLSLLTDGLQAEREQGITIDVAYRYFATPKRKFIIGDTPGHEQYTRNMVTAATTANLVVILVDARKGVLTQTRRHTYLGQPGRRAARGAGGEQDGHGGLLEAALRGDRRRVQEIRRATESARRALHPAVRAERRHGGGARRKPGLVHRPDSAGAAGDGRRSITT